MDLALRAAGTVLIVVALVARQFHFGLLRKYAAPNGLGRTWLLGLGSILILETLPIAGRAAIWARQTSCVFFSSFAMLAGVAVASLGARVCSQRGGVAGARYRALAAAFVAAGLFLVLDGWLGIFC